LATTALAATACPAPGATPAAPLRKVVLAARWVSIPLATTASAALVTSGKRSRRAAKDARSVGIHLVGTASRAAECHGLPLPTLRHPEALAFVLQQAENSTFDHAEHTCREFVEGQTGVGEIAQSWATFTARTLASLTQVITTWVVSLALLSRAPLSAKGRDNSGLWSGHQPRLISLP